MVEKTDVRAQLLNKIRQGEIPEAADLKQVILSSNRTDAAFALQLLGLRLAKKQQVADALQCLSAALSFESPASLKTVKIMESICGPGEYPLLYAAVNQFAIGALDHEKFEEALEALCYCLHLATYSGVACDQEKNALYQQTLSCYARISNAIAMPTCVRTVKGRCDKIRIAHILPRLVDEWSPVKLLKTFIKYHDYKAFDVFVYTTEQDVRSKAAHFIYSCFKQPSREISSEIQGFLNKNRVPYFYSDYDLPFIIRAERLYEKIQADRIDVAIYYGHNMCCIDALLAHFWPAPVQVNIDIGTPLFIPALDAVCQGIKELIPRQSGFWDAAGVKVFPMPSGVDSESNAPAADLHSFGISGEGTIVLSTCSSQLPTRMSAPFLETVSGLLKAYPQAYYLIVGQGVVDPIKDYFSREGLLQRVIFAGHQKDVPALMKSIDIYLNEFPEGGGLAVLEAMAAGKPVVTALSDSGTVPGYAGANYVGDEFSIKSGLPKSYFDFAARLIGDTAYRNRVGVSLRQRYENEFSPQKAVFAYEGLARELYSKKIKERFDTSDSASVKKADPV